MPAFDLARLPWTLEGWRPYAWQLGKSMETDAKMRPEVGPIPAQVPGSAQEALLRAGLLPDWHVGLNSRDCEWVEHRHWIFEATLPAGAVPNGERACLMADGLDYSGWILVDCCEVARFSGALTPHRIDLTQALSDGASHRLSIVFEEPPREQGQIGFTARSRFFKPRYNYSWDWCPRLVPMGISGPFSLVVGPSLDYELSDISVQLHEDNQTGSVRATVRPANHAPGRALIAINDGDRELARVTAPLDGPQTLPLDDLSVEPWWPNRAGPSKIYRLNASVLDEDGAIVWAEERTIGFKRIEWRPCEGAPDGAEPWLCLVNGRPLFLQGVNWTPLRLGYQDTTTGEYRAVVQLYKEMGCNLFRVWGGAMLESADFYDTCDRAGILVWQEFPLSSSGIDNAPPEDPDAIDTVARIAATYIQRRAHHPSLLLWCGGNELLVQFPGRDHETPVTNQHPCIAALNRVVERDDPGRRFVPSSPSGPRFSAAEAHIGKGLHHDVHGPWGFGDPQAGGFAGLDAWCAYWRQDDALFRSEVGMPGASAIDLIDRFSGGLPVWPPATPYWLHTAAWWTQWERFEPLLGDREPRAALETYIAETQRLQAEAYRAAAAACKARFPACGGFLIWMGHDCYPCPSNNSVIDFLRRPKPAYHALKEVFLSPEGS